MLVYEKNPDDAVSMEFAFNELDGLFTGKAKENYDKLIKNAKFGALLVLDMTIGRKQYASVEELQEIFENEPGFFYGIANLTRDGEPITA